MNPSVTKLLFGSVLAVLAVAIIVVGVALVSEINREPVDTGEIVEQPQRPVQTNSAASGDNAKALQRMREDERRARELQSRKVQPRDASTDAPKDPAQRAAPTNKPLQRTAAPEQVAPAADTVTLVAVTACGGGTFRINRAEKRMVDRHNTERKKRDLRPLCVSLDLTKVARAHSRDMLERDYFSHYTPEGTTVTDEMEKLGYPVATSYMTGENISLGGDRSGGGSPDHMFEALMDSPGHKANIVDKDFREVGVGAVRGIYQGYDHDPATAYTIDFGANIMR